jgi:hypothetical protein
MVTIGNKSKVHEIQQLRLIILADSDHCFISIKDQVIRPRLVPQVGIQANTINNWIRRDQVTYLMNRGNLTKIGLFSTLKDNESIINHNASLIKLQVSSNHSHCQLSTHLSHKEMKWLKWRELIHRTKQERYYLIQDQLRIQLGDLKGLRLRYHEIIEVFDSSLQTKITHNSLNNLEEEWTKITKFRLNHAYNKLIADGMKWTGNLSNNLNNPLHEICRHSIYALLLLDSLEAQNEIVQMNQLTLHSVEDIEALTKEKFGACPNIEIEGDFRLNYALPSYLHFSLTELLKNSIFAVIKKYGVLDLDDAAPISISLAPFSGDATQAQLRITDCGMGMTPTELQRYISITYIPF